MKPSIVLDPAGSHLTGEQLEVVQVIRRYTSAIHAGDTLNLRRAFHSTATLIGWDEGALRQVTLDQWFAFVESIPSPRTTGQEQDAEIDWLEVCGTAAVARVRESYRAFNYVDYLSLIKTSEGWRIVHKCYHQEKIE